MIKYFFYCALTLLSGINFVSSEAIQQSQPIAGSPASQTQPAILPATEALAQFLHEDNKKLIAPYFDENFYKDNYKEDLDKTGLTPIDHFIQHGWQGERKTHRDPNGWFNVTLYKERLWPCEGNPFVDFLKQPKVDFAKTAPTVEIFIKDSGELSRAWMATEAFLRLKTHKPIVRLSPAKFHNIPVCFKPMIERGLDVQLNNNDELSFYKSPFIQNPTAFGINPEKETSIKAPGTLEWRHERYYYTHTVSNRKFYYIMHRLPMYTNYTVEGRINPLVINIAFHESEPLHYCSFANTETDYKVFLKRISEGYDLVFTGLPLGVKNERIIPGHLVENWDNFSGTQLEKKPYELGYLLSLGAVGDTSYLKDPSRTYTSRLKFWEREAEITNIPRKFYVSNRAIDSYSAQFKNRKMPDDSKKWILGGQFNIAIENCRQHNYMTEKLTSCFLTLTVPIYLGCPNVTDYFDARGMLIAESTDDIIRIANSLTPQKYAEMLPYLKKNKEMAENLMKLKGKYLDDFYQKNMI